MSRQRRRAKQEDPARKALADGFTLVSRHPGLSGLASRAHLVAGAAESRCPKGGWALVTSNGHIHVEAGRRAEPAEWAWVIGHCLLHLGLGHHREHPDPPAWNLACDRAADSLLGSLSLGRRPADWGYALDLSATSEEAAYRALVARGVPADYRGDLVFDPRPRYGRPTDWERLLGQGLQLALEDAVRAAAGHESWMTSGSRPAVRPATERARAWFMTRYPLLGSLAASFTVVEDQLVCHRLGISVAAVSAQERKIWINPAAGLDEEELRFVVAHELLHVGLRHHARTEGRDPYLVNVAADYVINGWLIEMGVGRPPAFGLLHDPELAGMSMEEIYDRIAGDLRRLRRLATLRGVGVGDMVPGGSEWWEKGEGVSLDAFYRRALAEGMETHRSQGRGLIPAGLEEEIRAQAVPPIPWDVQLARWFDDHFAPVDTTRTYARASRRQAATPDIPRPRLVPVDGWQEGRTFGVVLDTSGSMDAALLARGLGAIANYAAARDVTRARVVFCDAAAHDAGYMAVEQIARRVKVVGRGGTVLQPGVDLLEQASDFPADGPILVITDGWCDTVKVVRDHAFLIPHGATLPFAPRGPVFRMRLPNAPREARP